MGAQRHENRSQKDFKIEEETIEELFKLVFCYL